MADGAPSRRNIVSKEDAMSETPIAKLKRILREKIAPTDGQIAVAIRRKEMEEKSFKVADDIEVEPTTVAGRNAEWLRAPGTEGGRSILYLHGGGYVLGSLITHRALAGEIARAAGAAVLLLDYRLAPEHPFPAAVEDGVAALRWLQEQGFEPAQMAVAGDSAGGGLTVATLLSARDQGVPLPGAAVCISPWADLTCSNDSFRTRAYADPMVMSPGINQMAALYLQDTPPTHPLASPNYADLQGLPPLLIHVGTDEVLLDDAIKLDARARAAGIESSLEVWNDMIHVWHAFHPMLPEGKQAIERVGAFLRYTWLAV
jgi:monoterpene epsilon-lactone hydrolase